MPKPIPVIREQRPTIPELSLYDLTNARWLKAMAFPDDVAVWKLYNSDVLQAINYGYRRNEPAPSVLAILDTIVYRTRPKELWLQRVNALSNPRVFLEVWRWE